MERIHRKETIEWAYVEPALSDETLRYSGIKQSIVLQVRALLKIFVPLGSLYNGNFLSAILTKTYRVNDTIRYSFEIRRFRRLVNG